MKQDDEAAMIGFFLLQGHTLDEMLSLSADEKIFYQATMELYIDEISKATRGD